MAAAPTEPHGRIGADLETVEPRDSALIRQFFTDAEAELVEAADDRDLAMARIWSAKEAALKLVGLGLRIDTRGVVVRFTRDDDGGAECPATPEGWQPIDVKVVAELPKQHLLEGLQVFWRRETDCVLTVACSQGTTAINEPDSR